MLRMHTVFDDNDNYNQNIGQKKLYCVISSPNKSNNRFKQLYMYKIKTTHMHVPHTQNYHTLDISKILLLMNTSLRANQQHSIQTTNNIIVSNTRQVDTCNICKKTNIISNMAYLASKTIKTKTSQ